LLELGYRVVGFDNLAPTYSIAKKRHNLDLVYGYASGEKQFQFVEGDLRDSKRLEEAMNLIPIDAVIHLAALAGVQPSIADPQAYVEVNVTGTLHVLETAKKLGIGAVVSASSSSVYGDNSKLPFSESDPVNHPISPYAATKRAGELLAYAYHHLHRLSIACLRFFTVYGPRQRPDLAIYKFARAMLAGREIILYGDGSSRRDYTYIDDCVDGILKAMNWTLAAAGSRPRYDIFNLGESQSVSLLELVAMLEKNLGIKAKRKHVGYLPGDVLATFADLRHSEALLAYRPQTKIEAGIENFCRWYLQEEKGKPWEILK
ncbi:MAG TPA: epimerase, partial [Deltaproteobacteria bacterium]|nr:epimerase [Deltaproteobacteria bacterium]